MALKGQSEEVHKDKEKNGSKKPKNDRNSTTITKFTFYPKPPSNKGDDDDNLSMEINPFSIGSRKQRVKALKAASRDQQHHVLVHHTPTEIKKQKSQEKEKTH